jgi:glutamate carboxypeptidase
MIVGMVLLYLGCDAPKPELTPTEREIADYIEDHVDDSIRFLERIVNINSGTLNHAGIREVGAIFREELDSLGFDTRWVSMPDSVNRAGHLFAERRGDRGKRILLIGHLDTVFEPDSPFQRFERQDSLAHGPGVVDMKGGDVVILYALKALERVGALEGTNIIVALTGDEESVGAPLDISRADLVEAAGRSDVALGFEGTVGGMNTATVARRGSSGWELTVEGERGHSSVIFSKYGSGAIFEAARILNRFYEDLRGEEYLTFNPGVILGGTDVTFEGEKSRGTAFGKINVVPRTVRVKGDLRFISEDQKERARAKMREIVTRNLPGTSAEITFYDKYPAMPPTEGASILLSELDEISRGLGYGPIEALDPGRRGAADISFAAPYVDGLDGIGVAGSGAHGTEEVIHLKSLLITTQRAAILVYRLTRGDH